MKLRLVLAAMFVAASLHAVAARAGDAIAAGELVDDGALVTRVLALADERLALMPAVAAAKWPRHLPVSDPAREAVVVEAAADRASRAGLAAEPVAQFLRLQIAIARDVQQRLFERWAVQGLDEPGPARDLTQDLRPRLDRITAALIEALYLAAPTLGRSDFRETAREMAPRILPAPRWTDAERSELIDALAQIHSTAGTSPNRARAAGVLRFGTPGDYAPFSVAADQAVTGADVELALRLAEELHLRAVFVQSSWRGLLDDLRADKFDIAVGGISVTPARARLATFSLPTARSGKTAIGRCADRSRFDRFDAIDDSTVTAIVNRGGTNEAFARSHLTRARVIEHADNRTIFEEIEARRADVMFTDETEVELATRHHADLCRLLPEAYDATDKAFMMPTGSGWSETVDAWLQVQLRQGTPARLLQEYLQR